MNPKIHKFTFTVSIADSLIEELGEPAKSRMTGEGLCALMRDGLAEHIVAAQRGLYSGSPEKVAKLSLLLAIHASLDAEKEKSTYPVEQ